MAWFNTDWNLGNMFNSPYGNVNTSDNPYGFTGGGGGGKMITPWTNTQTGQTWDAPNTGYQPPNSNWQMTGNNQTNNLGTQNSVWGAPSYYQEPTGMFGNPYQAQGGGYYNPNIFGQMSYPYQYGGGGASEQPWWMNYDINSSVVNPPNIPTTSVQPDPSVIPRPGGTGPGGKDLTHAETIKYFGLYDDAESAFAAGDKQAAYRKDHMHWRAGTGAWAGNGKQEGQSDLDYPGRTVGDNTIMGDREKLGGWSDIGNKLKNYLSLEQMFNITANDQGGNDYTVKNDGMLTLADGTTVETQVMSAEEKAAQDEMLKKQYLDLTLRRMEETRNPFDRETNYGYTIPTESTATEGDGFNPTNKYQDYYKTQYTPNALSPYFQQRGPQFGLPTNSYGDNIFNTGTNYTGSQLGVPPYTVGADTADSRFRTATLSNSLNPHEGMTTPRISSPYNFINTNYSSNDDANSNLISQIFRNQNEARSWSYDTSGFDSGDSRFKPAGAPRAYDINKARGNNIFEKSINLPSEQLGPYTSGGLSTNKDFFRQVFNQSGGIDPSQENPWFDELAYDAGNLTPNEEAVIKLREDKIRAMAKSKADAKAYERAQVEAAMAKSKADAKAYEAEQVAQEKAKQAKAQSYDTGYVAPNKYVQQYEQLKKAGAPVRRSGNRYGFGL